MSDRLRTVWGYAICVLPGVTLLAIAIITV